MAIQFQCPGCNRRLSIASRKAGTRTACPACQSPVTVPGALAAEAEAVSGFRAILPTACVAVVLCGGLVLVLFFALRKPTSSGPQAQHAPVATQTATPPTPATEPTKPALAAPNAPSRAQPSAPNEPAPNGTAAQPPGPQINPPTPQPQTPPPQPAPQPPPVSQPAPKPPAQVALDKFGNPVGPEYGLGRDGEFKGTKLLFWCAFENAGNVFFGPTNPLWKALEVKGFVVSRAFGKFNPAWLKGADQLWIVSSGRMELPPGVTPDLLADAVSLLPAEAVPSGFTLPEYQFVVRATLDVAFSARHPLDENAYRAIEEFVKAGKGLCLLADDEPFTAEADELARRLFGARVSGNYLADKVAVVKGRGLTAAEIRKFGGQFEVPPHALLTDVNFLFEGITVSHVGKSDKLEPALTASDGRALLAVSKVPGQRVVIDCGFTRYCHGPTERTSYVSKTPGTVRLGQNVAAYLAGKGATKKP